MRIDVVAGQQIVLFGTEQSLRSAENSSDEASVVPRVHGFSSLMTRSERLSVVTIIAKSEAILCEIRHYTDRNSCMANNASATKC